MTGYQALCWDCRKPRAPEDERLVPAGHPAVTQSRQAVCAPCALKRKPINYGRWFNQALDELEEK